MVLAPGYRRETVAGAEFGLYVPESAIGRSTVPIMVTLHGADRGVEALIDAHREAADRDGVIIVAPLAYSTTWDAVYAFFGPDVPRINAILLWLFERAPSTLPQVGISGFSDGATYAIGLGRANGGLFSRIVAYSPGFLLNTNMRGRPPITVSHGRADTVLSFAYDRDTIVPALREEGYEVEFVPFDGAHVLHRPTLDAAVAALASRRSAP